MAAELQVLALAGLLAVAQLLLFAVPANLEAGSAYLAGPRDEGVRLTGRTGRLQRAFLNHVEGLVLFTGAVVAVVLSGKSSAVTEAAAWTYLAARVVYVPCYWTGVRYLRSLVWLVGMAATILMLALALA